jgi:hypothetical protein
MSTKITTIFVAVVIAFSSLGTTVRNSSRNNEHMFRSVQYCVPDYDISDAQNKIYC